MQERGWSITWEQTSVPLRPGRGVTFGRSTTCDITVTENDTLVSRHAGTVLVGDEHLEIVNTSTVQKLLLIPNVGPQIEVRAGCSATSRGMPVFSIVLTGRHNAEYVLEVRGPGSVPQGALRGSPDLEASTVVRPFELTAAESAIVQALCGPMLLGQGRAAVPATYQQAADAVSLTSAAYVRNRVKAIRDRATEAGIPGLGGENQPIADDYRRPFCEFAIANGWAYGD
jgi:hypothetical protein